MFTMKPIYCNSDLPKIPSQEYIIIYWKIPFKLHANTMDLKLFSFSLYLGSHSIWASQIAELSCTLFVDYIGPV